MVYGLDTDLNTTNIYGQKKLIYDRIFHNYVLGIVICLLRGGNECHHTTLFVIRTVG